jgi:putative SOS response-associated peptidase YedK
LVRLFQWGLVPAWADSPKAGARAINARAETLADKPTFAGPVRGRRCVVLANGYYEWQRLPGGGKRPHWIAPPDGQILGFAGLWDCWRRPDGSPLYSFGIVTVPANARLAPLHERMPALLPPSEWRRYCDPALPLAEVLALLGTAPPEALEACPVPDLVNRVAEEGPALLGGE